MKESYQFHTIKEEIDRKKVKKREIRPQTSAENPVVPLRQGYLDLVASMQPEMDVEVEMSEKVSAIEIKKIKEIISPELHQQMMSILKELNAHSKKTKKHDKRDLIDLAVDDDIKEKMEDWINNLKKEVSGSQGFTAEDLADIEAQSWIYFESFSQVINAKSVEKDISDFYASYKDEVLDEKQQKVIRKDIVDDFKKRYKLSTAETEVLVDLTRNKEVDPYNIEILLENMQQIWNEYKLGDKKKEFLKIGLGYFLAEGMNSFTPSLFQNMLVGDKLQLHVLLESLALGKFSQNMERLLSIELAKVIKEINEKVNEKISNSIFFHEFEFIHDQEIGEYYVALTKGKESTSDLINDFAAKFTPQLMGTLMSLGFVTRLNPILGGIGLSSMPLMFHIAKKQTKKLWPMHAKAQKEQSRIATNLTSIKQGYEQVRTSEHIPAISEYMQEQLNEADRLNFEKKKERGLMGIKMDWPFFVSSVVGASIGWILQRQGLIEGGAVLSNAIYTDRLNRPIRELVGMYYGNFPEYIQDIEKMNKILGKYEELDLPEGEKEKARKVVSELNNFDLEIKNLAYKGILEGINLKIKQGEFLAVSGESGAGKSTLLRNIVGLFKPEQGEVKMGGENIEDIKKYGPESIYSVMSYSNQSPIIFPQMTVRENLLLWARDKKVDKEIKQVLKELNLDDLGDRLDEKAPYLSGGEKVRFGLARTLLKDPKIMLLDEPTSSLDSRSAEEVRELIVKIHKDHKDITIICVSHDLELIKQGDRQLEIKKLSKKKKKKLNYKFFVATQFHPEFKSRPLKPHPLFKEFIKAAIS